MAYAIEHSARLQDPSSFKTIRREKDAFGVGIDALLGGNMDGTTALQSIHFDANMYSVENAMRWLRDNDKRPIAFESGVSGSMNAEACWVVREVASDKPTWRASGAAEEAETEEGKVPIQRFQKDIIRTGEYVKLADGIKFAVTAQTLQNWVMQFRRMKANGVKVGIPDGHQNEGVASKNLGWVEDLWVQQDGERQVLMMSCRMIGREAIEAAAKSDVSLNSPPVFVDGTGNVYVRPITHVAVCTDPVVPGLGEFVPLAASLKFKLRLQNQGVNAMDFIKQIAAMIGLDPASLPPDDAQAQQAVLNALAAAIKGGAAPGAEEPKPAAAGGAPVTPSPTVKKETLTREFSASQSGQAPNPHMVRMVSENRQMKIDKLITSGKLTPAAAAKLVEKYIGKDNEAVVLSLSAGSDGSDFEDVVAVLEANEPVIRLGEKSGHQSRTVVLSDKAKGEDGKPAKSPIVAAAERRAAEFEASRARRN